MMLGRDPPAILIFWSEVRHPPIHAGDLDPHLAPLCTNVLPPSRQSLTHFIAPPNAESRRLGKDQLRQCARILRLAQHREQGPWPVLLHLDRHTKSIQRSFFE